MDQKQAEQYKGELMQAAYLAGEIVKNLEAVSRAAAVNVPGFGALLFQLTQTAGLLGAGLVNTARDLEGAAANVENAPA